VLRQNVDDLDRSRAPDFVRRLDATQLTDEQFALLVAFLTGEASRDDVEKLRPLATTEVFDGCLAP
jgi:hypothetical protein